MKTHLEEYSKRAFPSYDSSCAPLEHTHWHASGPSANNQPIHRDTSSACLRHARCECAQLDRPYSPCRLRRILPTDTQ